MVGLLAVTVISCRDALGIISRISRSAGLSYSQRIEVIQVLQEHIPTCPVVLKEDERPKRK